MKKVLANEKPKSSFSLGRRWPKGRMRGLKLHSPHPNPLPEEREQLDAKSYYASGCEFGGPPQTLQPVRPHVVLLHKPNEVVCQIASHVLLATADHQLAGLSR